MLKMVRYTAGVAELSVESTPIWARNVNDPDGRRAADACFNMYLVCNSEMTTSGLMLCPCYTTHRSRNSW